MIEIYKDVSGYEGLYQVSNLGEVRSLGMYANSRYGNKRFVKGRMLKPRKTPSGYLQVHLHKDGKVKFHSVHRLVAQAFIENPDNLPEVNHIDEDKTNNRVDNLEWCDHKYNMNHGTCIERMADAKRGVYNTKKSEKVIQMTLDYIFVKEWPSIRECERNGFCYSAVCNCCNGKRKTHKGYRWMFAKDYYNLVNLQRRITIS